MFKRGEIYFVMNFSEPSWYVITEGGTIDENNLYPAFTGQCLRIRRSWNLNRTFAIDFTYSTYELKKAKLATPQQIQNLKSHLNEVEEDFVQMICKKIDQYADVMSLIGQK